MVNYGLMDITVHKKIQGKNINLQTLLIYHIIDLENSKNMLLLLIYMIQIQRKILNITVEHQELQKLQMMEHNKIMKLTKMNKLATDKLINKLLIIQTKIQLLIEQKSRNQLIVHKDLKLVKTMKMMVPNYLMMYQ